MENPSVGTARREFLKFLAASPYVAALGGVTAFLEQSGLAQDPRETAEVIASPAQALNVFDFEEAAHRKVQPGHWAYMASGVDDDATLRANRDGFKHVELRPRRLRDATKWTCAWNWAAPSTTARSSPALRAARNHFSPTANWPSLAPLKLAAHCNSCPRQPRLPSKT